MARSAPFTVNGSSNVLTFAPLREQIEMLLSDIARALPSLISSEGSFEFLPAHEVLDSQTEILINIELAGVMLNDVSVSSTANSIVVSGQKRSKVRTEGDDHYFSNRAFGAFSQSFTLPVPVDTDRVTAESNNGVLSIRAPKSAELVMPTRTVPITS